MTTIHVYGTDERHRPGYNLTGYPVPGRYDVRRIRRAYRMLRRHHRLSRFSTRSIILDLVGVEVVWPHENSGAA